VGSGHPLIPNVCGRLGEELQLHTIRFEIYKNIDIREIISQGLFVDGFIYEIYTYILYFIDHLYTVTNNILYS